MVMVIGAPSLVCHLKDRYGDTGPIEFLQSQSGGHIVAIGMNDELHFLVVGSNTIVPADGSEEEESCYGFALSPTTETAAATNGKLLAIFRFGSFLSYNTDPPLNEWAGEMLSSMDFSPSGRFLYLGTSQGRVLVHYVGTPTTEPLESIPPLIGVQLGSFFRIVGNDGVISISSKMEESQTGELTCTLSIDDVAAFAESAARHAASGEPLILRVAFSEIQSICSLKATADNLLLAVLEAGYLCLFRVLTEDQGQLELLSTAALLDPILGVVHSKTGRYCWIASERQFSLYDAQSLQPLMEIRSGDEELEDLEEELGDDEWVEEADDDFDDNGLNPESEEALLLNEIACLAFSPDDRFLALGGESGDICFFELGGEESVMLLTTIRAHLSAVEDIQIVTTSALGPIIISLGEDQSVRAWTTTGARLGTDIGDLQGQVTAMTFDAVNQVLFLGTADGEIYQAPISIPEMFQGGA